MYHSTPNKSSRCTKCNGLKAEWVPTLGKCYCLAGDDVELPPVVWAIDLLMKGREKRGWPEVLNGYTLMPTNIVLNIGDKFLNSAFSSTEWRNIASFEIGNVWNNKSALVIREIGDAKKLYKENPELWEDQN